MGKTRLGRILLAVIFLNAPLLVSGQGFIPPEAGNAVVYFVRVAPFQYSVPFTFFDGNNFIADFPSRNYYRYETTPGKHLFWASCDNNEYLPAELKANETYVVLVEALQGSGLPKVALVPMHIRHKDFHKAKHMIENKAPVYEDSQKVKEENERMKGFIQKSVNEFQPESEGQVSITSEVAIPIEKFRKSSGDQARKN